jgi:hypothetical protein
MSRFQKDCSCRLIRQYCQARYACHDDAGMQPLHRLCRPSGCRPENQEHEWLQTYSDGMHLGHAFGARHRGCHLPGSGCASKPVGIVLCSLNGQADSSGRTQTRHASLAKMHREELTGGSFPSHESNSASRSRLLRDVERRWFATSFPLYICWWTM